MRKLHLQLLALFLTMALAPSAWGGWVLVSETVKPGMSPMKITNYYQGGRFASVTPYGTTIIDAQKGLIIQTDPWKKVYAEATAHEMAQKIRASHQKVKAWLASLTPKDRAHVEKMLGIGKKPKVTVKKVCKESLLGHPCQIYEIDLDGEKAIKLWITQDVSPFPHKAEKKFRKLVEEAFPEDKELSIFRLESSPEFRNLTHQGLVLKLVDYRNDAITRALVVKEEKIPTSQFKPPIDYKKVSWEKLGPKNK